MIYREKKIYSGNILEVEIYPISLQERKKERKKKERESLQKQKNLNDKNARKHVTRLINNNFTDLDLAITLTYSNKYLPKNQEEARKDVINYLRRIKRYRKKEGLGELKYIAVIEYKEQVEGKSIRIHHHLIISGMDRDKAEELWGKGRANADRLKADEFGYEAIGRYITKDPKGNRRWTQSRNLDQPTVKVNDFKYSKKKVNELAKSQGDKNTFNKLYPEYFLNECKAEANDLTGYTYLYIKMRKLRP